MDEGLAISAGTVDITPQWPAMLGGFDKRKVQFKSVADRLEANVLVIRNADSRVIIVSTDLLYPGETLRQQLLTSLDLRGDGSELFLCASHTHYAPMTAPSMPRLGVPDPDYVRFVSSRIAELVVSIERGGEDCFCSYHEGKLNHSINRRLRALRMTTAGPRRGIGFGPNPAGQRDESLRILKFHKADGRALALIWNYACHPCDFVDPVQVSAAYPGVVRRRLRAELGDIPVLFFQGFSGDVRPPFSGISDGVKGVVKRALRGPQFKTPRRQEWEEWSESMAAVVVSLSRSSSRHMQICSPIAKREEVPESEFAVGGDCKKSLFWHTIDLGGCRIVGINAEPVVEYRQLIEKHLREGPLFTVGCLDQTHCYLPIDAMIAEGGYEVEGFRKLFGFDARFRPDIQDALIHGLTRSLTAIRSRLDGGTAESAQTTQY
jgi:hypothetical protein